MKHDYARVELRNAVGGFLFSLRAEGKSNRTIEYYDDLLRCFLQYTEVNKWTDKIQAVSSIQLRQFLSWVGSRTFEHRAGNGSFLFRKAKASTAWPYFKALRRFFNWSIEEGLIKSSPVSTIHFKTPPPPPIEPFTTEEIKKIIAVCDLDIRTGARFTGLRNRAMILLFIDSALRRNEMVNLRVVDVELEKRYVRVLWQRPQGRYRTFLPRSG